MEVRVGAVEAHRLGDRGPRLLTSRPVHSSIRSVGLPWVGVRIFSWASSAVTCSNVRWSGGGSGRVLLAGPQRPSLSRLGPSRTLPSSWGTGPT